MIIMDNINLIKECSIAGCVNTHYAHGLCNKHYQRMRKTGSVKHNGTERGLPLIFIEVALRYADNDCLIWPYSIGSHGYGQININCKVHAVHRLICEKAHGVPSKNLEAAHSCGNRKCVNPSHLSWKTSAGNHEDKYSHKTDNHSVMNWVRKLNNNIADEIRENKTLSIKKTAMKYGISNSSVVRIRSNKQWVNSNA